MEKRQNNQNKSVSNGESKESMICSYNVALFSIIKNYELLINIIIQMTFTDTVKQK